MVLPLLLVLLPAPLGAAAGEEATPTELRVVAIASAAALSETLFSNKALPSSTLGTPLASTTLVLATAGLVPAATPGATETEGAAGAAAQED